MAGGKSKQKILKAPTSELQIPEKHQGPNIETAHSGLALEVWSFAGAWMLEFED
jgi:hypothetical protein